MSVRQPQLLDDANTDTYSLFVPITHILVNQCSRVQLGFNLGLQAGTADSLPHYQETRPQHTDCSRKCSTPWCHQSPTVRMFTCCQIVKSTALIGLTHPKIKENASEVTKTSQKSFNLEGKYLKIAKIELKIIKSGNN